MGRWRRWPTCSHVMGWSPETNSPPSWTWSAPVRPWETSREPRVSRWMVVIEVSPWSRASPRTTVGGCAWVGRVRPPCTRRMHSLWMWVEVSPSRRTRHSWRSSLHRMVCRGMKSRRHFQLEIALFWENTCLRPTMCFLAGVKVASAGPVTFIYF